MAWYNPFDWGRVDPEKYDPNSANAKAARTFGGPNTQYDISGQQARDVNTANSDSSRAQMQGFASTLQNAMNGQGPSAADAAASAQRRAALSNAAALNAGARGRSAVGSSIVSNAAASQGVQQAAQNQMQGKMQEMAQARGEYGSQLNSMRNQDLQNEQLRQQNNQFNANILQNALLANQQARLNIGKDEMAARLHQGDMEFTNLDPGSAGILPQAAAAAGKILGHADGTVVNKTMGIGTRVIPLSEGDMSYANVLAQSLLNLYGGYKTAAGGDQQMKQAETTQMPQLQANKLSSLQATQYPNVMAGGLTPPPATMAALAKGGILAPHTALIGEAGPEAVVDIKGVVDRPTVTQLGKNGPQAVIPLGKGHEKDRARVLNNIVKLCKG